MNIMILHRIPFAEIGYDKVIDHRVHEVTYAGPADHLGDLPSDLRCRRLALSDFEHCDAQVLAWTRDNPGIERVISLSEYDLLNAARLRELLDVEGARLSEVEIVRNKVKMKQAIQAAGLDVPAHVHCQDVLHAGAAIERLSWSGKTILKPVYGAASRDTRIWPTLQRAVEAIRNNQTGIKNFRPEDFEIEEFVEGRLFHVDGMLHNGQLCFAMPSLYIGDALSYANNGSPLGSVELDADPSLIDWAFRCARALGLRNSAFHLEAIFAARGLVFMELGARVGAARIPEVVTLATGVPFDQSTLALHLFGEPILPMKLPGQPIGRRHGWFVYPGHHLQEKWQINGLDRFKHHPYIMRLHEAAPGQKLTTQISYAAEEIPLSGIVCGDSSANLDAFLTDMLSSVRVVPEVGKAQQAAP